MMTKTFDMAILALVFFTALAVADGIALRADQTAPAKKKAVAKRPLDRTQVVLDKNGNLVVRYTVAVPVLEERIVRVGDEDKRVTATRIVTELRERTIAKGAFQVFDARGKVVGNMALAQLLEKKREVFFVRGGKLPDAEQLKSLDKDALIVVQRAKPKTGSAKP